MDNTCSSNIHIKTLPLKNTGCLDLKAAFVEMDGEQTAIMTFFWPGGIFILHAERAKGALKQRQVNR